MNIVRLALHMLTAHSCVRSLECIPTVTAHTNTCMNRVKAELRSNR